MLPAEDPHLVAESSPMKARKLLELLLQWPSCQMSKTQSRADLQSLQGPGLQLPHPFCLILHTTS